MGPGSMREELTGGARAAPRIMPGVSDKAPSLFLQWPRKPLQAMRHASE